VNVLVTHNEGLEELPEQAIAGYDMSRDKRVREQVIHQRPLTPGYYSEM
jgi:hypothetical protein